jgi:hypothetical protein
MMLVAIEAGARVNHEIRRSTSDVGWIILLGRRGESAVTLLTRSLAEDDTGAWMMAFEPDELHLFIALAEPGASPDPVGGMTVEDFLVTLPRDELHEQAHHSFLRFLTAVMTPHGTV